MKLTFRFITPDEEIVNVEILSFFPEESDSFNHKWRAASSSRKHPGCFYQGFKVHTSVSPAKRSHNDKDTI